MSSRPPGIPLLGAVIVSLTVTPALAQQRPFQQRGRSPRVAARQQQTLQAAQRLAEVTQNGWRLIGDDNTGARRSER